MGCRDTAAGAITKQHGQAIGGQHGTGNPGFGRPTGIRFGNDSRIGIGHRHAMHLPQPGGRAVNARGQALTIVRHRLQVILDMLGQIEGVKRRQADAAGAGGHAGLDPRRGRPVRQQPIRGRHHQPINASRS